MGAINRVQGAYQPDCWGQVLCRTSWQIDEETPESWHSLPFGRFVVDAVFLKTKIYIYNISWYKMEPCPFTIAWHQRSSVMSAAGLRHVAIIYTINRWSSFQIESYQPWKPTKFTIVCLLTYSIPLIIWSTHCQTNIANWKITIFKFGNST